MGDIGYFVPSDIDDAVRILAEYRNRITVFAGGTDLVPRINYRQLLPDNLMHLGRLGLNYIKMKNDKLVIGATTSTAEIAVNLNLTENAAALSEAARRSGSVAIRTAATIGGNLVNASPAADLATPLLVMDAELHIGSVRGRRVVAVKDFFAGPGQVLIGPDELLLEIYVPKSEGQTVFLKLGRRKAQSLSVANVAVRLVMNGEKCRKARIAVGAMAPIPLRCTKAEKLIKDNPLDNSLIDECADKAISQCDPIDDQRASAWYRKKAGKVLVARALMEASGLKN